MSMVDKIGSLIISVEGTALSAEDRDILAHPLIGGAILFSRNYESRAQLQQLCKSIRASHTKPLLITVDQEGGRVQRFINEFTRLPPLALYGEWYDREPQEALHAAKETGWLMALELLSLGIDLSFAPVLDLLNKQSKVIGNRAFHANPKIISELGGAFAAGMKEAGMVATGKHFPGHGSVNADSHLTLPVDVREWPEVEQKDLVPFMALMKAPLSALMVAHIIFPRIDQLPVSFSSIWIKQILRQQLQFNGVIFTDDLNMAGANISSYYPDRVQAAREAGCDFLLLCNNRDAVIQVLDHVPADKHQVSAEKWMTLQAKQYPQNNIPPSRLQAIKHIMQQLNTAKQKEESL
jgi:beta-N-acetylhexosaminidase